MNTDTDDSAVRSLIERTMDVTEFCTMTGIKRRTCYHYLRAQLIPSIRLGRDIRIPREAADKILTDGLFKRIA